MRELRQDISEVLLAHVQQPAQYCGLEHNRRCGDVTRARVRVALAFPDAYSVGISHLGSQILYTVLNAMEGVACDRAYCPLLDAEAVLRREGVPLFGVESRAALADFDVVGFSLSYELVFTNVLTMLDLAGIPLHADQRGENCPIIVAGGTQADAPEVMADFIDLFLVGDGEQSLPAFVELVAQMKRSGASRQDILLEAAKRIPSAYVPSLWQPSYGADGTLASLAPTRADIPETVQRSCVPLESSPAITHPLVPAAQGVFERISLEIMRGCPQGCRFCHAGATTRPLRQRTVEEIIQTAQQAIDNTGYDELSLLSLSTSDYPGLGELMAKLNEQFSPQHVSIAVPSLRVSEQLVHLPWQLNQVRKGGMTIAAEVGTDRLRQAIHKRVTNEDLLAGCTAAYSAGWKSIKVYFMAGFPGESDDDLYGIMDLCRQMSLARKSVDNQKGAVNAAVSWLVPKPHTPMQWAPQADADYFWHVRRLLKDAAARSPVQFRFHRIERSGLEAVIARGDRRLGAVIERAWRAGARFDGWDEHFNESAWRQAFEETGLDPAFFGRRQRPTAELLPWDHIRGHRGRAGLVTEWEDYLRRMEVGPVKEEEK